MPTVARHALPLTALMSNAIRRYDVAAAARAPRRCRSRRYAAAFRRHAADMLPPLCRHGAAAATPLPPSPMLSAYVCCHCLRHALRAASALPLRDIAIVIILLFMI